MIYKRQFNNILEMLEVLVMEKYEKPVMEILTMMKDEVFTLIQSTGDGTVTGGDGEW